MDVKDCGLGFKSPVFHDPFDVDGIQKAFYRDGAAFISNVDEEKLVALGESLGTIVKPRNDVSGGKGVSNIRCAPDLVGKGKTVGKGYSNQELFFHTDRSGWDVPPRLLMTSLKTRSVTGGESVLVDGRQLLTHLSKQEPFLYSLITNSKYSSFKAEDGSFVPRPIYDEKTGIFRFRFDDGIQMGATLIENFPKLMQITYKHAFAVRLEVGQCYIVDNTRYLHGRTSFTGARELLRVLAYPHPAEAKKFILFDVDGTLCRAEDLSVDAYYRCVSDIADKEITNENTKVNLHGQTDLSLLRNILEYHGFLPNEIHEIEIKFFASHPEYFRQSLRNGFSSKPCSHIEDALDWISQQTDQFGRRVSIGLLTGNSQQNALMKIDAAGLPTDIFDLSISAFGDQHPRRSSLVQDSIQKIESKYGIPVQTSDITLIGDTPLDIECAKETGCRIIAVATGSYDRESLASYAPDFVCQRLPEAKSYVSQLICA